MNNVKDFRGYAWCPAAVDISLVGGLVGYVRYKMPRRQPIYVRSRSPHKILLDCPDRDILLLKDHVNEDPYVPPPGVWDEVICFSNFMPNSFHSADIPFWMVNYTAHMGNVGSHKSRQSRERLDHESYIISDSGGFQLAHGRLANINPDLLIKWYNENVDLGMVLDIPTSHIDTLEEARLLAKAQAVNTERMMQQKRDGLELINIIHGTRADWWEMFYETCHRPDIKRLAVGGAYNMNFLSGLDRLFRTIDTTRPDGYEHYHVLGVWNLLQVIPFMRIQAHDYVPVLTSDSSTHVQNANARNYAFHPSLDSEWRLKPIGFRGNVPLNSEVTLPCTCPVCYTLKYMEIFSVLPGALVTFCLMQHNMFAMNQYVRNMREPVKELSAAELKKLMQAQVGNRRGFEEAVRGIDFVDSVIKNGHSKTRARYSMALHNDDGVEYQDPLATGLFDSEPVEESTDSTDASATAAKPALTQKERHLRLAAQYIAQEPIKDHGKKTTGQKKGLKVVISHARKQGGLKAQAK